MRGKKRMKLQYIGFLTVGVVTLLSGCGSLASSGQAPDELAVISGPSLTVPPNFELRPPQEAQLSQADALRNQDASKDAKKILLGAEESVAKSKDVWLLQKAKADKADPLIRQILRTSKETEE